MENFNQSLPGIAQIGYVICDNIQPNIVLKHSSGTPVGVFTEIVPVRFFGVPTCETSSEYDSNGRKVVSTLKFVTNDNIPLHKHLAFVISDTSGTSYIIGSRERPYPVIKSSANSGTPSGESMPLPTKSGGLPFVRRFNVPYSGLLRLNYVLSSASGRTFLLMLILSLWWDNYPYTN